LDELASSAQSKASFLGQVGMTLPSTHVLTIQAYTEESPLYTELNATCRAATHTAEQKLRLYRDYLYHMEQALSNLPSHIGLAYRGIRVKLAPTTYVPGTTITWQPLSSASKSQTVPLQFVITDGSRLSGTYFVIESNGAKEIQELSTFPDEEEVVFRLNAVFTVTAKLTVAADKAAALPGLGSYDLTDLDVYRLTQF